MLIRSNKKIVSFFNVFLISLLTNSTLHFSAFAESKTPKDMVLINYGGFMRGIDNDPDHGNGNKSESVQNSIYPFSKTAFKDESPAKMIYLSSYFMDKYEVSNGQYTEFIKATDYPAPAYWDHHQLNKPDHPVVGVNWYDANAYCHWANKRLPTEAEWEKAARGPAGLAYPWGNEMENDKANFQKGKVGTIPVTEAINARPEGKSYYGVYNMAGNVFEWVQDWYNPNYYKTSKESKNPQGPNFDIQVETTGVFSNFSANGKKKVIRGGSWFSPAQSLKTTHRFWNDPMNNSYGVGLGFRCARDAISDPQMQGREFYMEALIHTGVEKYQEALVSINQAIQSSPDNAEYRNFKTLIEKQSGP